MRYLKYVFVGLILMAPQEGIVALFKGKPFVFYLMALAFWSVMLSIMYGLNKLTKRFIKRDGWEITFSIAFYTTVALCIEWGIIGNSPWHNPNANQLGLVAGWVSVFLLPRAFLEEKFKNIRKWSVTWYIVFLLSLFLPVLLLPGKGPVVGIIIYGYSVIPFFFLSLWYAYAKSRKSRQNT